ncbi:hypothetical protein CAOG_005081 [Capsaspora owczarzaki ATCC 30864]|uniref:Uncharacterized protein n=1 Tax=Capsaspora owczarzaki (strain ATCC 30864) TaxID=595528 RepID=A0A0D2X3J9_CAPO3|nr:hypothetical protein CAOG_005081 [Capsaspora owczarzaki ATCC 30864]
MDSILRFLALLAQFCFCVYFVFLLLHLARLTCGLMKRCGLNFPPPPPPTQQTADNQRLLMDCGGINLVVQAMRTHASNSLVQAAGCMAIQNATWLVADNRVHLERTGAIPLIFAAMRRFNNDPEVLRWGCGALQNLACADPCSTRLIALGALELVTTVMRDFPRDSQIQGYALGICRNLSYLEGNREVVGASSVVPLALGIVLANPQNTDVAFNVCSFFINMLVGIPVNVQRVLAIPNLLDSLFRIKELFAHLPQLTDKLAQIFDLLGGDRPFIAPALSMPVPSLFELTARVVLHHDLCSALELARARLTPRTTQQQQQQQQQQPQQHADARVSQTATDTLLVSHAATEIPAAPSSMVLSESTNDLMSMQLPSEVVLCLAGAHRCDQCGHRFLPPLNLRAAVKASPPLTRYNGVRRSTSSDWFLLELCSPKCVKAAMLHAAEQKPALVTTTDNSGEH